jgi:hypothetical protein
VRVPAHALRRLAALPFPLPCSTTRLSWYFGAPTWVPLSQWWSKIRQGDARHCELLLYAKAAAFQ